MKDVRLGAAAGGRAVLLAGAACMTLWSPARAQQPLATIPTVSAPPAPTDDGLGTEGYYLEADLLIRDDKTKTMTARGDVEARYQGRTLRAQEVIYDTQSGVVTARGEVQLINADGTAQFAEELVLDKDLRAGFAKNFSARLDQNVKIAAATAIRRSATVQELNQAVYTPCEVCAEKPNPTWSLSADKVVQDKDKKLVYYHHATIRLWGAPLMYLPVFWHPDPQAVRSSGFLTPKLGFSKRRGASYQQPYLQVISPSQDVIISPQINTKINPFLNVNYRKRFYSGMLEARVGGTYEKDVDNEGERFGEATFRSYILAKGAFDIDEKWKWGFAAERVSDKLIFDNYDVSDVYQQRGLFTSDDHRLLAQLFTTRQDERSYVSISALSVQGLRAVRTDPTTGALTFENSDVFPTIGPLIEARWQPESPILGGRLRLQGAAVLLNRAESEFGEPPYFRDDLKGAPGVDSAQTHFGVDWRSSLTLKSGVRIEPFLQGRGDAYHISDLPQVNGEDTDSFTRALGVAGLDLSYPLFKAFKGGSVVLEPLAQIAVGSDSDQPSQIVGVDAQGKTYFYNEDSATFEFDETNLFQVNKSPGFDLYEGGERFNVGGRATVKYDDGRGGSLMVGRSFRSKDDPLLPDRSGLSQTDSDWIVAAEVTPIRGVSAFARSRLDREDMSVNRLEAGVDASTSRGFGSLRYLKDNEDTSGFKQENLDFTADIRITERWGATVLGRLAFQDHRQFTNLTEDEWSWTRRDLGVYYKDDCIRIDVIYQNEDRYSQTENSGLRLQTDESIVVRLTLATLGDTGYSE